MGIHNSLKPCNRMSVRVFAREGSMSSSHGIFIISVSDSRHAFLDVEEVIEECFIVISDDRVVYNCN